MRRSLLLFPLLLTACDGGGLMRPDSGATDAAMSRPTTYYDDVRPILVENCVMCHTDGGIAPFALESYDAAVEVANRMEEVTRERIMPPFLADNSGDCQTWSNFRGLTQEEIDTVGRWVAQGTLEGDPSAPVPEAEVLPTLARVDVTIEMEDPYTVDGSTNDDYRCFVVDPGVTADAYVTGYDVHPGNPQRVHHVIVYNPLDAAAAQSAIDLDMADGVAGDGYPCFGGPRVDAPPLVLWAPGTGATLFPRGTGLQIAAGRPQIIQIHYNNLVAGAPNDDLTRIDLMTEASANPAYFALLADFSLNLPPRMPEVVESQTQSLSFLPAAVRVWGMLPHMHTLGRSMRVELAGSSNECLLDVPRWDFNWQLAYWLDRPVTIRPTDSATITCTYNTMERDETVTWGDGTQDEMCLAFVYVTL